MLPALANRDNVLAVRTKFSWNQLGLETSWSSNTLCQATTSTSSES